MFGSIFWAFHVAIAWLSASGVSLGWMTAALFSAWVFTSLLKVNKIIVATETMQAIVISALSNHLSDHSFFRYPPQGLPH